MALTLKVQKDPKCLIVFVEGDLDAHFAPEFEKKMEDLLKKEQGHLIIELSGVKHVASAGFGALMPVKNIQDSRKHKLILARLNENVKKVFKLLGFHNVLKAFDTLEEAKKAI